MASDRGPIGRYLFEQLRTAAIAGGAVGDDAITALAESRRREAIETLSELADRRPTARAALRATGELAIPVLAQRARTGSVAAVDDLAAIGTPAAAVAIAEQLWQTDDVFIDGSAGTVYVRAQVEAVAVRAAWRLAALIGAPDVEGELARFDPAPFRRGDEPWYDWLWAPFTPAHDGDRRSGPRLAVTMGRVGWLLDNCADDEVPADLGPLDARLALGLGARADSFRYGELPTELKQRVSAAANRSGYHSRYLVGIDGTFNLEGEGMLGHLADTDPETAGTLAGRMILAWVKDARRLLFLRSLPAPVLIGLARWLLPRARFQADVRDWRTLDQRPERPRLLLAVRNAAFTLAVLLGLGAAGVALVRSVGTLIGWWSWGPRWFAAAVLLAAVVAAVAAAIEAIVLPMSDAAAVTAVIAGGLACLGGLVIAAVTTAGWLGAGWFGWLATISIALLAAGSAALLSEWADRRERALNNPYRALLQLDARTALDGATVIARRATT